MKKEGSVLGRTLGRRVVTVADKLYRSLSERLSGKTTEQPQKLTLYCDGWHDDTQALQAWFDDQEVFWPDGTPVDPGCLTNCFFHLTDTVYVSVEGKFFINNRLYFIVDTGKGYLRFKDGCYDHNYAYNYVIGIPPEKLQRTQKPFFESDLLFGNLFCGYSKIFPGDIDTMF